MPDSSDSATLASDVEKLLASARAGSNAAVGRLLSLYANYLRLIVATQMDARLRTRVNPSDVVQETFLEAHRDFATFRGESPAEFVAWVRRILVNNVLRVVEQHFQADKRDVRREVSLEDLGRRLDRSTARLESLLAVHADSPSACAERHEHELLLANAVTKLSADHRDVIVLRHFEGLPFDEVAKRMGRSAAAVRMLWMRALRSLGDAFGRGLSDA
jgi:RNA polymerase sigma-70 factor (ECF subfamily)